MIEPERVLHYFECISHYLDEERLPEWGERTPEEKEIFYQNMDKFMKTFYIFCHVGTAGLHKCQHPDWEEMFLKAEQELVDTGNVTPWAVKKQRIADGWEPPQSPPVCK
jgi:hypothetical protein